MTNETKLSDATAEEAPGSYLLPCTVAQRTCWYLDRMAPGTPANNIAVRFLLEGPLDPHLCRQAFQTIIERHEVLRTRFVAMDGDPKQLVEARADFALPLIDLRHLPASERDAEAENLASKEARTPFDIEKSPLLRGTLLQTADEAFVLLVTIHHIVSDGWSVGILTNEFGEIYAALALGQKLGLAELPLQYGDYACWQENLLSSPEIEQLLTELNQKLDGFEPISIPTDFERPLAPTARGEIRSIVLPRALTDSLKRLSDQRGCTLFVTMYSALLVLLHQQSNQKDLTIRTQTSGRQQVELEELIGWFVNSIILRLDLTTKATFGELMAAAQKEILEAFTYQQVPFERAMEVIRPRLESLRQPPFQVNFIFQRDFVRPWHKAGIKFTPIPSKAAGTFVDLNMFLVERDDGWRASIDVATDVFLPETGEFFLQAYKDVLEYVAKNPACDLSSIPHRRRSAKPTTLSAPAHCFDNYVPPRNEHERTIIDIWTRVLNVSSIGAYSNFFDLGGHSLNAVSMLGEFRQVYGLDINLPDLFTDPTPAAMAQVISGEGIYSDPRDIIPIQPEGSRPPFFMVGGDHWFRPLARYVGLDQPFMGLPLIKYRHLDLGKERLSVANDLADLLVAQYGSGPFLLGGWCADGITAFETARAIEERGSKVGLVVLFDAMNPGYYREVRALVHSAGRTITSLRSILVSGRDRSAREVKAALSRLGAAVTTRLKGQLNRKRRDDSSPEVFFPLAIVRPPIGSLEEPALGWGRVCRSALTVVETPGDHSSIFKEPHVQELGRKVRRQLDAALARQEG